MIKVIKQKDKVKAYRNRGDFRKEQQRLKFNNETFEVNEVSESEFQALFDSQLSKVEEFFRTGNYS